MRSDGKGEGSAGLLAMTAMLLVLPGMPASAAPGDGTTCATARFEDPGLGAGTLGPGRRFAFHLVEAALPQNVLVVQPGTRTESLPGFDVAANVDMHVYNVGCTQQVCASTNPMALPDVCVVPAGAYVVRLSYVSSTSGFADWFIAYLHGVPAIA